MFTTKKKKLVKQRLNGFSSKLIISQEGYWYKALLFLKKGEKENAKKVLHEIISIHNYYKYKEAKEILKELYD